jgi:uncharacterized protein (TIGR00255 family)
MKSMTGYGRGECVQDGFKITVELSSVNRKQGELSIVLPRELEPLEARVRDEINRQVARGRTTVRINLHAGEGLAGGNLRLNVPLAKAYIRELRALARELKLPDAVSLDHVLRAPGVIESAEDSADAESFWPAVAKALGNALVALVRMREREGAHLARDLGRRIKAISASVARIHKQAPQVQERYRQQLIERIRNAGIESPAPDDERLIKEVVYFADRSDITEELTRLESHLKQFADCVRSDEPVGRTLDFLSQEMNREVNTIGSKANDSAISREVVQVKAELEKFREQVQNVE